MTSATRRFWAVFVAVAALIAVLEAGRWTDPETRDAAWNGWLAGQPADFAPFLPLFVLTPVFYGLVRRGAGRAASRTIGGSPGLRKASSPGHPNTLLAGAWGLSLVCAALAFGVSVLAGRSMEEMPPAYHDEFSYLFQTQTFAAGRLSFPSFAAAPELFDQMHVLNEGRFASRYFPGAGLWFLPFHAMGQVWLAPHVAQAILALSLFWTGRSLGGTWVGMMASLLCAVSPGLVVFSNTLLAHHPTLVGLSLFLVAITRFRRSLSPVAGVLAGIGLAFAMICRPMTAAGFALPWGVWFVSVLVTGWPSAAADAASSTEASSAVSARLSMARRLALAAALGGPLVVGVLGMVLYNRAITGSGVVSPYQQYTDLYTPRHVYGFDNVVRGERHLGPKVLDHYDRWAENLTPGLAARNVGRRTASSLRWTLGIVPLTFALLWLGLAPRSLNVDGRLIAGAVLSLHAVHVPYWFEGIMGWHYVFETAPLLLLLFGEASRQIVETWRGRGRSGMVGWWGGLIGTALLVNLWPLPPLWPGTLSGGLNELAFSRRRHAQVEQLFEARTAGRPAIVFIVPDPADRHIDHVYNTPALDGRILRARLLPGRGDVVEFAKLFPDRDAWRFDAATGDLRLVREARAD